MKTIGLCLVGLLLSSTVSADVRCNHERIKGIQVRASGHVVYITEFNVRRLAALPSSPASILKTLMHAIDHNYYIQAGYPDGYNCDQDETKTPMTWVYIQTATHHPLNTGKPKSKKSTNRYGYK